MSLGKCSLISSLMFLVPIFLWTILKSYSSILHSLSPTNNLVPSPVSYLPFLYVTLSFFSLLPASLNYCMSFGFSWLYFFISLCSSVYHVALDQATSFVNMLLDMYFSKFLVVSIIYRMKFKHHRQYATASMRPSWLCCLMASCLEPFKIWGPKY